MECMPKESLFLPYIVECPFTKWKFHLSWFWSVDRLIQPTLQWLQQPYKSVHSKDKTECGHDKEAFLKNEKSGSAYLCLMYRQKWVWGNFIM
ncbi:hypothetical protein BBV17_09790 [Cytobacillus oceanisediminis]|jgi:hypothetical protein|uniref:Uncharacterized protein n=1 Tax=Cytobacillus oceanisediminis TaxID=665099 RepID=A0ABX3CXJ5_9BACI|nr:hypothetical protein BBV17_09790 [Cytobacillus oceanisediminis]